jgi:hypothetical protein
MANFEIARSHLVWTTEESNAERRGIDVKWEGRELRAFSITAHWLAELGLSGPGGDAENPCQQAGYSKRQQAAAVQGGHDLQSSIFNRQSTIGNQQSAINNRQSTIPSMRRASRRTWDQDVTGVAWIGGSSSGVGNPISASLIAAHVPLRDKEM